MSKLSHCYYHVLFEKFLAPNLHLNVFILLTSGCPGFLTMCLAFHISLIYQINYFCRFCWIRKIIIDNRSLKSVVFKSKVWIEIVCTSYALAFKRMSQTLGPYWNWPIVQRLLSWHRLVAVTTTYRSTYLCFIVCLHYLVCIPDFHW